MHIHHVTIDGVANNKTSLHMLSSNPLSARVDASYSQQGTARSFVLRRLQIHTRSAGTSSVNHHEPTLGTAACARRTVMVHDTMVHHVAFPACPFAIDRSSGLAVERKRASRRHCEYDPPLTHGVVLPTTERRWLPLDQSNGEKGGATPRRGH